MSKQFRKEMGFTNKGKFKIWLKGRDIIVPNYPLLQKYNSRLSNIFNLINQQLEIPFDGSIDTVLVNAYNVMKDNHIIERLNNNGRSCEEVYYKWMQGYLAERIFTPFMMDKLNLIELTRNGGDDFTNIDTFKRTGDADLVDTKSNIFIDVQCGTGDGVATIKKHKVDQALKVGGTTYVCMFGLFTGTYGIVNLNELKDAKFYKNESWENALCWDVPPDIFKNWYA
jgi:hypothetical protein